MPGDKVEINVEGTSSGEMHGLAPAFGGPSGPIRLLELSIDDGAGRSIVGLILRGDLAALPPHRFRKGYVIRARGHRARGLRDGELYVDVTHLNFGRAGGSWLVP
jgi:hypothetical protein